MKSAAAVWPKFNPARFVATAALISFGGFLLFAYVTDFPPWQTETILERALVTASVIISWPLALAFVIPENSPAILGLSLFAFPGLFWAILVELFMIVKNACRA
jgi:hypothetical protein